MYVIEAEVYSFGGCSSCGGGNNLYSFLKANGIAYTQISAQITYKRNEATERAKALGVPKPYFPMIFIGGKVVNGFKPDELTAIITEIREAQHDES